MDRFERRKQIFTSKGAVEVLPAISVERREPGIVIYDRDVVHTRERREIFERFRPKFNALVDLRPNRQGRQRPL